MANQSIKKLIQLPIKTVLRNSTIIEVELDFKNTLNSTIYRISMKIDKNKPKLKRVRDKKKLKIIIFRGPTC